MRHEPILRRRRRRRKNRNTDSWQHGWLTPSTCPVFLSGGSLVPSSLLLCGELTLGWGHG